MRKLHLFLSVIIFVVTACSMPEPKPDPQDESFDPDMCSEQMGYERGTNDGRYGRPMNSKFLLRCREDLRAAAQKGYRQGYNQGMKAYQEAERERNRNRTQANIPSSTGGPSVNINIGHGNQTVNGGGSSAMNDRAYYCSVRAFTSTFEDFGPTLLEAKKKVREACSKRYHPMHCEDVQCQKNE